MSREACDERGADLCNSISTPSLTVGHSAAKMGARNKVVDISLTHLKTELRNVLTGLKNRQPTKGLFCISKHFALFALNSITVLHLLKMHCTHNCFWQVTKHLSGCGNEKIYSS